MKRYAILVIAVLFIFFDADYNQAADIKQLMEIGASQSKIAKSMQQETKNYNAVKNAINAGVIKDGMASDLIRKKYGVPIIDIYDKKQNLKKWLYMPASSSHFKGEKLYLYIDSDNNVNGWEIVEN